MKEYALTPKGKAFLDSKKIHLELTEDQYRALYEGIGSLKHTYSDDYPEVKTWVDQQAEKANAFIQRLQKLLAKAKTSAT